jgi:hypothetical protein
MTLGIGQRYSSRLTYEEGVEYFLHIGEVKNQIYTVNHFYFLNEGFADRFLDSVRDKIDKEKEYPAKK